MKKTIKILSTVILAIILLNGCLPGEPANPQQPKYFIDSIQIDDILNDEFQVSRTFMPNKILDLLSVPNPDGSITYTVLYKSIHNDGNEGKLVSAKFKGIYLETYTNLTGIERFFDTYYIDSTKINRINNQINNMNHHILSSDGSYNGHIEKSNASCLLNFKYNNKNELQSITPSLFTANPPDTYIKYYTNFSVLVEYANSPNYFATLTDFDINNFINSYLFSNIENANIRFQELLFTKKYKINTAINSLPSKFIFKNTDNQITSTIDFVYETDTQFDNRVKSFEVIINSNYGNIFKRQYKIFYKP